MLNASRPSYGVLEEVGGMDNRSQESRFHVGFDTKYEQFRRTDAGRVGEHGFVKIRAKLSVQYVAGPECRGVAAHLRRLPTTDAHKSPGC